MYQALYRKWRPKTFADVVGQEHITETLQRQVAEGRLSHAYLFTGTRGTGKTTCAKILARAVNCEHPENGNPCNRCPSCLGIESGRFLDVVELDAASNNGVDSVRALRDEAIYSPAQVKKRVYIVDEVHMLSTPAFNALLKILEEPPEHLMFILATTELHKVPATILSRCQRFSFRRIQPKDIVGRLNYIAQQENIDLKDDGAALLARLSDGALRDALSLLDQCAAVGGAIDAPAVLDALGLAGNVQTAQLMSLILTRDARGALALLGRLYDGGKDVGAVLGELSTLSRELLISATAGEGGESLLSGAYDASTLDSLRAQGTSARFIQLCTILQETAAQLQFSVNRRTDAELCILKLCDETLSGDLAALGARIARLEEQKCSERAGSRSRGKGFPYAAEGRARERGERKARRGSAASVGRAAAAGRLRRAPALRRAGGDCGDSAKSAERRRNARAERVCKRSGRTGRSGGQRRRQRALLRAAGELQKPPYARQARLHRHGAGYDEGRSFDRLLHDRGAEIHARSAGRDRCSARSHLSRGRQRDPRPLPCGRVSGREKARQNAGSHAHGQ